MMLRQSAGASVIRMIVLLSIGLWAAFIGSAVGQGYEAEPHKTQPHGHESSIDEQWVGSATGKEYSERNHRLAGLFLLLVGFSELGVGWGSSSRWIAGLLPASLVAVGLFLLVWSDHEAWPIGSLSWQDTFFGSDKEMVQHKVFALLSLMVGTIEGARLMGWLAGRLWTFPLPLYAMVGGILLLAHDHGHHPQALQIAVHHTIMGLVAIVAGAVKLRAGWTERRDDARHSVRSLPVPFRSPWALTWSGLVFLIGLLLITYRE